MSNQEKIFKKSMSIAEKRFLAIAPALDDTLSAAEHYAMVRDIARNNQMSERTVYRLLKKYRQGQFDALKPKRRSKTEVICTAIKPEVLKKALELKIELPSRSVPQIILALKLSGLLDDCKVASSTLRRYLSRVSGLWRKPGKVFGLGSRKYRAACKNKIWQSDFKESREIKLWIADNSSGFTKRRLRHVYLAAFIDDNTRLLCHGEWYFSQTTAELLDCYQKAIVKYGLPHSVYTDNGCQYTSGRFGSACAQLGVRHILASVGRPEGKGKIERFNRTVEEFVQEMTIEKPKSLDELNKLFRAWVDVYNNRVNSEIKLAPQIAFNLDQTPLRRLDFNTLRDKCKAIEWRKVSKNGCIKLNGKEFDCGNEYIGKEIQIRFEELDNSSVEIWDKDEFVKTVQRAIICERNQNFGKSAESRRAVKENAAGKPSEVAKCWLSERDERLKKQFGGISFQSMNADREDNTDAV